MYFKVRFRNRQENSELRFFKFSMFYFEMLLMLYLEKTSRVLLKLKFFKIPKDYYLTLNFTDSVNLRINVNDNQRF